MHCNFVPAPSAAKNPTSKIAAVLMSQRNALCLLPLLVQSMLQSAPVTLACTPGRASVKVKWLLIN